MLQYRKRWRKKSLDQIADLYQPKTISQEDFTPTGYPVFGANGIIGFYKEYNHELPQVLITCRGSSCGTINLSLPLSWITGNAMVVNVDNKSEINKEFLYHILRYSDFSTIITGTGQPQIVRQSLIRVVLTYPIDKIVQTKIANILSACDEVIEKTKETVEKYKKIKDGMMQDLFSRGLDENGKLRPSYKKVPELYKYSEELERYIPREWNVKRLSEISVILSGKDYKNNPKGSCNIPIYGTGGVMGYTTIPLYSGPAVLTGRKGSINNPYYVEGSFWNVDTIFCLKMLDDNNANWFYYQIYITDMTKYNEATGVPSTTSKTLNKVLFAVPKSSEQIMIAKYIREIDRIIEVEEKYLNKYIQIKHGLMKKLLTPPADAEIIEG